MAQLDLILDESFSAGFSDGATNPAALTALMHYLRRSLLTADVVMQSERKP